MTSLQKNKNSRFSFDKESSPNSIIIDQDEIDILGIITEIYIEAGIEKKEIIVDLNADVLDYVINLYEKKIDTTG